MPATQINTFEERFWNSVYKTQNCWFWIGYCIPRGYGRLNFNDVHVLAHWASWFLTYGVWSSLHVLHHCDIKQCVRPSHLFEGTNKDNLIDAAKKGTWGLMQNLREFCKNGHPLSGNNLYVTAQGWRACRICHRQWDKNFKLKTKSQACCKS